MISYTAVPVHSYIRVVYFQEISFVGMGVTKFSVILLVSSALLIKESYAEAVSKDYCVVGAGPAGLQIGSFLSTANRDYVIFERGSAAGMLDYKKN